MQGEISWCLSFIFAVFIDFLFSLNIYESLKKKMPACFSCPTGRRFGWSLRGVDAGRWWGFPGGATGKEPA